jgi:hypothetical protein
MLHSIDPPRHHPVFPFCHPCCIFFILLFYTCPVAGLPVPLSCISKPPSVLRIPLFFLSLCCDLIVAMVLVCALEESSDFLPFPPCFLSHTLSCSRRSWNAFSGRSEKFFFSLVARSCYSGFFLFCTPWFAGINQPLVHDLYFPCRAYSHQGCPSTTGFISRRPFQRCQPFSFVEIPHWVTARRIERGLTGPFWKTKNPSHCLRHSSGPWCLDTVWIQAPLFGS